MPLPAARWRGRDRPPNTLRARAPCPNARQLAGPSCGRGRGGRPLAQLRNGMERWRCGCGPTLACCFRSWSERLGPRGRELALFDRSSWLNPVFNASFGPTLFRMAPKDALVAAAGPCRRIRKPVSQQSLRSLRQSQQISLAASPAVAPAPAVTLALHQQEIGLRRAAGLRNIHGRELACQQPRPLHRNPAAAPVSCQRRSPTPRFTHGGRQPFTGQGSRQAGPALQRFGAAHVVSPSRSPADREQLGQAADHDPIA